VGQERIRERGALQFEKIIQDDYVKFVRLAQTIMDSTSHGIVGYITNHGWLENRALRGMRSSLLETFSGMRVLDLHGNSRKGEYDASGGTDENVFDIEQGVAITLALRNTSQIVQRVVREDLFGTRLNKYAYLGSERVGILGGSELLPVAPNYTLKSNSTSADEHYETWPLISECFEIGSMGVVTARDHISIDFEPGTLLERAKMFANLTIDDAQLQTQLSLDAKKGWDLSEARKALAKESKLEKFVKPILYRAMDQRNVFYHPSLVWGMSRPTMKNMVDQDNIGITVARNATLDRHGHSTFTALATKTLIGHHVSGIGPVNYLFPLWQGPSKHEGLFAQERTANLDVSKFQSSVKASVSAQECFNYVYGILWSDTYRDRYKQELLLDFPRIPLPKSADLLRALSTLGAELVSLHSFSRLTAQLANQATLSPTYLVENVHFRDGAIFLNKSETTKLATVNETVWKYQVGGYQVCKKWLEDRRGRELTLEEIAFFHGMVSNILETIRISKLADEVIDQHGGWPDAFHSSSDNSEVV
jgi:predicted helicase